MQSPGTWSQSSKNSGDASQFRDSGPGELLSSAKECQKKMLGAARSESRLKDADPDILPKPERSQR